MLLLLLHPTPPLSPQDFKDLRSYTRSMPNAFTEQVRLYFQVRGRGEGGGRESTTTSQPGPSRGLTMPWEWMEVGGGRGAGLKGRGLPPRGVPFFLRGGRDALRG